MTMRSRTRGFTLIELMVTVVILGILAAIAIPNYSQYIRRAHRAEGVALLNEAAAREERYYSQNNTYTSNMADLGLRNALGLSDSGYYKLSIDIGDASGYLLSVAPQGGQTQDTECGTLRLNARGERSISGTAGDSNTCWK
jgi:type IV pilus assembly protein PilE